MISSKALQEFKEIWKKEIGTEISDEQAMVEATQFLTLLSVVYRPIKKEWLNKSELKQEE